MKTPELWFIRHGETDWNKERRIQGQTDTPLNSKGHAQAGAIAQKLKRLHNNLEGFELHVSPLHRTRQTMQYILDGFSLGWHDVRTDDRLKELNFGVLEGSTWPELNARGIDPEKDAAGYHAFCPPEGESYADATVRVANWLGSLTRPSIVVAHGGISRIVRGLVLDLPVQDIPNQKNPQWQFYRLSNGVLDWFDAKSVET